MNILIVDDNKLQRQLLAEYLSQTDHQFEQATDGHCAIDCIQRGGIDMVLMDVEMPGIDGFETTRQIRNISKDEWIPILFLTAKTGDKHFQIGIEAGGDDYLAKPVSPVILHAKLTAMSRLLEMRQQLQKLNDELTHLAVIDTLTDIHNRRGFHDEANRAWRQATRESSQIAVIMIDVDHFKLYNDNYGHQKGDDCLKQVANALRSALMRPCDMVARYGGEEFIALLPQTDQEGAKAVAERLRHAVYTLNLPHLNSPTNSHVTISLGVACCKPKGRHLDELVKCADDALYQSKANGRNRVTLERLKPRKTVMLVDDDDDSRHLVEDILQDHCNVVSCNSGKQCLEQVESVRPDLILLDIMMPDVDGYEVCSTIKTQTRVKNTPVLFLSSLDRAAQIREGKKVGGSGCIEKPFDEMQLLAKVNAFLG